MSAFTESALLKKLAELNASQQSIQTLSLWLIHHRKHHAAIIKVWIKEIQKVTPNRKLVFMYLANDVIQNSKKKGPEYGKEFGSVLSKAFKHISETCKDDKTFNSLDRILSIWEQRGVYDSNAIKDFYQGLHSQQNGTGTPSHPPPVEKKRKVEESTTPPSSSDSKKAKSQLTPSRERVKSETVEINGKVETHITLSPHIPIGDPPEPEVLIKMLQELDKSASSDAPVREKIANLPPEVSELALLTKLEDKEAAQKLSIKVNDALKLLNDYNNRLAVEMSERKKLSTMLNDFQREQQELLAQAEKNLEQYTEKLGKIKDVQKEIKNHLQNLPDLRSLPDVTGGLAPLPSAGDLFNIHHN